MAVDNTPKIDPTFSDVAGGSGSVKPGSSSSPDFSDVRGGSSSTAPLAGQVYIVKAGDSLSKIAKHFYGDANMWKKIHAANRDAIPNPDLIHPGLKLTIPEA
ncbi:MAG: LysM peptidoglycan-binding domain-containing protein [Gemmatimonadales bacterium]